MKLGKLLCCLLMVIVLLPACTLAPASDSLPTVAAAIPTSYPTLTPIPSATAKPAATETIFPQPTPTRLMSTPELIEKAFDRGEISNEERLLYLAYAFFEYESLPSRFQSNVGWRGTNILGELEEAANSPSVVCSMSPNVRSEFQRLLRSEILCK